MSPGGVVGLGRCHHWWHGWWLSSQRSLLHPWEGQQRGKKGLLTGHDPFINIRKSMLICQEKHLEESKPLNLQIHRVMKGTRNYFLLLPCWKLTPPSIYLCLNVTCIIAQTADTFQDSDIEQLITNYFLCLSWKSFKIHSPRNHCRKCQA